MSHYKAKTHQIQGVCLSVRPSVRSFVRLLDGILRKAIFNYFIISKWWLLRFFETTC